MLRAALAALGDGYKIDRCCALSRLGRALFSTGNATEAVKAVQQAITLARQIGESLRTILAGQDLVAHEEFLIIQAP